MNRKTSPLFATLLFLAAASAASAHPGHSPAVGIATGFAHPLSGWDHLLTMLAIGLWSVQPGGRACWRVPAIFVGIMALAAVAGHYTGAIPGCDAGIAAGLVVLGLLIGAAARLPAKAGYVLAGLFAVSHGLAHGAEMPATVGGLAYGAGFLAATAALIVTGMVCGSASAVISQRLTRFLGWGVAAAGVAFLAA